MFNFTKHRTSKPRRRGDFPQLISQSSVPIPPRHIPPSRKMRHNLRQIEFLQRGVDAGELLVVRSGIVPCDAVQFRCGGCPHHDDWLLAGVGWSGSRYLGPRYQLPMQCRDGRARKMKERWSGGGAGSERDQQHVTMIRYLDC